MLFRNSSMTMPSLDHFMAITPWNTENIGYGDHSIYNTVDRMKGHVMMASRHPYVREWARHVLGNVFAYDKWGEGEAIHNFVRDNVRYTRDPLGWEYVQTPPHLLEGIRQYKMKEAPRPIGDCDDMTTLGLAMAKAVGFPTAIRIVSYRPDRKYQHVYGLVNVEGQWIPFDSIRPEWSFGETANKPVTRLRDKLVM